MQAVEIDLIEFLIWHPRETSFNMTREDEDIEEGVRKFLDTRKGGSENQ